MSTDQNNQFFKEKTEQVLEHIPQKWEETSLRDDWDKEKEMDFTYTNIDKFIRLSCFEKEIMDHARLVFEKI